MTRIRPVLGACLIIAALIGAACWGGEDEERPETLEDLVAQVADIRGLDAPDDFDVVYLRRSDLPGLLDELITPRDRELFAETTRLYRLVGYIENDEDYLAVYRSFGAGSILGLYAPDRDTLWVVHGDDDAGTFEMLSRDQIETLAHEVVHALQDYHFTLDEDYYEIGADMDRALAWTAVIEGDATLHEGEFSDEYLSVRSGAGGPVMMLGAGAQQSGAAPSSAVVRELFFPYTTGADAVEWVVGEVGIETVNGFLANPPRGTTFILHPERIEDEWEPVVVALPDLSGALGPGWERESGGAFGEFHLANYLQQELSGDAAIRAADGWAGDRYDVYTDGEESVAVFRVVFSDTSEAAQFRKEHETFASQTSNGRTEAREGLLITELGDGDVLVRADSADGEALFAIGSEEGAAVRALEALLEG